MRSVPHLVVMSLVVVALAGCGNPHPPTATQSPPPALASVVVHAQTAHDEQVWDGVVEAVNQATITAQTNARVLELPDDVNDIVAKGEVLAFVTPPSSGLRIGAHSRVSFTHPALAARFADLLAWRDALYAKYREVQKEAP